MDMAMLAVEAKPIGIEETAKKLEVLSGAAGQAEVATKKLSSASGGATGAALAAARAYSQEGSAAAGASKQLEMMARAANQNGSAMGSSMLQMRMAAMQLSQVAQQAQTTGNILGALAIQLPDLALGFGPVGIAAGIAAGAALTYFSNISDTGPAAAQELKRQEDMIQRVSERWGEALPALQAYLAELNRTKEQSELLDVGKRLGEQEFAKAREQLVGLNDEFSALIVDMQAAGNKTDTILDLQSAFRKVQTAVAESRDDSTAFKDVQDALASSIKDTGIESLKTFTAAFTAFGEAVRTAAERAAAFQDQAMRAAILGSGSLNRLSPIFSEGGRFFSGEDFTPGDPAVPTRRPLIEMEGLPGTVKADRARRTKVAQVDTYASSVRSMQERIAALQAETAAQQSLNPFVEDYGFALSKARASAELLAAAERAKKQITPELLAGIDQTATALANATAAQNAHTAAVSKAREAMDFARDTARGFLDDLMGGLKRGEGFWKSFADAALNALNRIASRLLDSALDSLFSGAGLQGLISGGRAAAVPVAANDNLPAAAASSLSAYARAIQSIESGGNYGAMGPITRNGDRAYGAFQVMGANIGPWSEAALGRRLSPDQFLADSAAQDAIFNHRFGGYVNRFGASGAAQAWFGGPGSVGGGGAGADMLCTTGNAYVEKFNMALDKMAQSGSQVAGSLGGLSSATGQAIQGVGQFGSGLGQFSQQLMSAAGGGSGSFSILGGLGSLLGGVSPTSPLWAPNTTLGGFLLKGHAKGGISDVPAIFGEAGPEAAVPLPDGRRIPVDLRGSKTRGGMTYAPVTNLDMRGSNWTEAQIEAKLDQRDQRIMQHLRESEAALPERVNYINKHPRKRPRP